jgi:hypothetical protein
LVTVVMRADRVGCGGIGRPPAGSPTRFRRHAPRPRSRHRLTTTCPGVVHCAGPCKPLNRS